MSLETSWEAASSRGAMSSPNSVYNSYGEPSDAGRFPVAFLVCCVEALQHQIWLSLRPSASLTAAAVRRCGVAAEISSSVSLLVATAATRFFP